MATFNGFKMDPLYLQRLLKFGGYYRGKLDGIRGPQTIGAEADWMAAHEQLARKFGRFSDRTEGHLLTVLPLLAAGVRRMLAALRANGDNWELTCGTRSYKEQDDIYAQGRSKPGSRVTNAKAGQSYHNYGLAVDLVLLRDGAAIWDDKSYKPVGVAAGQVGLVWGGSFKSLSDSPHVQLGDFSCSVLQRHFNSGSLDAQHLLN